MGEAISAQVREVVEDTLQRYRVPGIVVAVAPGDRPVQRLVVGTDAAGRPLAEDSLFPVASITKLAVALAVLRLADTGALNWEDPLARYLPDAEAAQPGVTVRALMTHTSGLPPSYPEEAE